MIIARAPFRVSLIGGGTDYPTYYKKFGGCVIGGTINQYCYVTIRKINNIFKYKYRVVWSKNEISNEATKIKNPVVKEVLKKIKIKDKIEIHFQADLPKNSGVGSSSSFCVALVQALLKYKKKITSKKEVAKIAIDIEQNKLKEFCGSQDQTFASNGGFNFIYFNKNGSIKIKKIKISKQRKKNLEDNLILMFTGYQRNSKLVEKKKQENIKNKYIYLHQIKKLTFKLKKVLESGSNLDIVGHLLNRYWNLKKKLAKNTSNKKIDNLYNKILNNGSVGAKLIGSGNGGFFLIYCKKKKQNILKNSLKNYTFLNLKFTDKGSEIIYKDL